MIQLSHPDAEIYYPQGSGDESQISRTTHLGVGAHQDDLEILAIHGILEAYDDPNLLFTGVTVTDGRGAPRSGIYENMSDDDLWKIRCAEQKEAADIGRYNAQFLLNYASVEVKSTNRQAAIDDLKQILKAASPAVIYTHNPADKHDTHVAVLLAVLQALRELTPLFEDVKLYGCEVWRSLDWLVDEDKIALDVSGHIDLQEDLLTIFDSQISGGKHYDQGAIGRRLANATYDRSHETDKTSRILYAMDLTPLIQYPKMDIETFTIHNLQNFAGDVTERLNRLRKDSE